MMNRRTWIVVSVAAVVCWIGLAFWWRGLPSVDTSSRGSRDAAALGGEGLYVAELMCADCHAEQAEGHQRTGHANTFRLTKDSPIARQLGGTVFQDPERGYAYHYHLGDQGLSVAIPELLGEDRFPLTYELGSGHNAVTFLSLLPDRLGDTVGVEHRVSLYRGEGGWELDLTPGHQRSVAAQEVEGFGKLIRGDTLTRCIGCHTISAELGRQELQGLRPHVGCQSCHGPGREHVIAMESGGRGGYSGFTEMSAMQEMELCGRCHRLPEDEPHDRLSPNIIENVRFQPAGLLQSRCFTKSGTLKCTTCHDPHQPVSRDQAYYEQRCLDCHRPPKTACPVSPSDNCISCHMPAIDVHRGIKFHDHWIRVRRDQQPQAPE